MGQAIVLYDASSPGAFNRRWTYPGGTSIEAGVSFTPPSPGCYTVSMTAYFPSGAQTASTVIAVGGVTCN